MLEKVQKMELVLLCYVSASNNQIKEQRQTAMWINKIKKGNFSRRVDHNTFWVHPVTNSSATTLSTSRGSASSNVSDIWLMRAETQKHIKKVKKDRDKITRDRWQEEVCYILKPYRFCVI
jgi:hypothetical protein